MQSRSCLAFAIIPHLKPCQGVIVFESQLTPALASSPWLDQDRLRRQLKIKEREKLVRLLDVLERIDD